MSKKVELCEESIMQGELDNLVQEMNKRGVTFQNDNIYILPETMSEKDILNEFAPDLKKVSLVKKIPCEIVCNKKNYSYLSLRDSEIILPFIISMGAGAALEVLKYYITKYVKSEKQVKIRLITKKRGSSSYKKITLKGDANSVVEALRQIKIMEDNDEV